jgi:hypothetical protein
VGKFKSALEKQFHHLSKA